MQSAKEMHSSEKEKRTRENTQNFVILNHAIASFNNTAQELEQSYRMLRSQVKRLNRELEEKNRQLEKNLQEKERVKNFLSSILESLPTGVMVVDLAGNVLMCNSAVIKITGACPSQMQKSDYESLMRRLGINDRSPEGDMCVATHSVDFYLKNKGVRHLKVLQSPVTGSGGEPIGALHIIQDQTRLRKLEVQSERDKRLKAMGEMAIKIAHEVRNPLGSIELLASILKQDLEGFDDSQRIADRITTEVKSLDNTISNLLLFTRQPQPVLSIIDLEDFLGRFVEFVQPVVSKSGVMLDYAIQGNYAVRGDRDLLKQVFLNLTLNAVQAMPDGGCIKIRAHSYADDDEHGCRWVETVVADDGDGIDPESINSIFHPFYTTKEKGTGLGLAIVHNIIESHNGVIEARSRPGKGSSFLISLPLAEGAA